MTVSKVYPWLKQTNRFSKALSASSILSRRPWGAPHSAGCLQNLHGTGARLDAAKAERLKPMGIIDEGDEQFIIR